MEVQEPEPITELVVTKTATTNENEDVIADIIADIEDIEGININMDTEMKQKPVKKKLTKKKRVSTNSDPMNKEQKVTKKHSNYYDLDIGDIQRYVIAMNKYMELHPEFFRTRINTKFVHINENAIHIIYGEPVVFNDSLHGVKGYIKMSYNTDDKKISYVISIKSPLKEKRSVSESYILKVEEYVNNQLISGNVVSLYYNKLLSDTIIKYNYYNQSINQWKIDVKILQDEFFLNNKDYLLAIMNNKATSHGIGSISSSWNNMILHGPPGTGKCLGRNTPILMYNGGIKMVQDIKLDDVIMGDDSTPRTIETVVSGKSDMYKVSSKDSPEYDYVVNKYHVLSLYYTGWMKSFTKTPSLKHDKDTGFYVIEYFDKHTISMMEVKYHYDKEHYDSFDEAMEFYNNIPDELGDRFVDISIEDYLKLPKSMTAELMGYRTSVAYSDELYPRIQNQVNKNVPAIRIFFDNDTTDMLDVCKNNFHTMEIDYRCAKENDDIFVDIALEDYTSLPEELAIELTTHRTILVYVDKNLFNFNLCQMQYDYGVYLVRHNKEIIPNIYKYNIPEKLCELLAGIIDTAGYIMDDVIELPILTCNDDIMFIASSLGYWVKSIGDRTRIGGLPLDRILYKCKNTDRDTGKPDYNEIHRQFIPIDIEEIGADIYYGFSLDGNHRFVMGNFVVTHNSSFVNRTAMTLKLSISSVDLSLFLNKKRELYALLHGQDFNLPNSELKQPALTNCIIALEEFDTAIERILDIENIFKYKDILKRNYLDMKNAEIRKTVSSYVETNKETEISDNTILTHVKPLTEDISEEEMMERLMLEDGIDVKNNTIMEDARDEMMKKRSHDNQMSSINIELNNIITSMDEDNKSNILRLADLKELLQPAVPIKDRIIIATTNHYDKIKNCMPALFRSGRMSSIEFGYLDWSTLNKLTNYYFKMDMVVQPFKICIPTSEIIELAVRIKLNNDSFSNFQHELMRLCGITIP